MKIKVKKSYKENMEILEETKGTIRWLSKSGKVQYIEQMSDKHLENSIAFLEKKDIQSSIVKELKDILKAEQLYRNSTGISKFEYGKSKFRKCRIFAAKYYDCALNELQPLTFH